jgi:hypothetical protein
MPEWFPAGIVYGGPNTTMSHFHMFHQADIERKRHIQ